MKSALYGPSLLILLTMIQCTEMNRLKPGQVKRQTLYQSEQPIGHPSMAMMKNDDKIIVFESHTLDSQTSDLLAIRFSPDHHKVETDTLLYSPYACLRPAVTALRDGLLMIVFTQRHQDEHKGCHLILSYDNGRHYSAPRKIDMTGLASVYTYAPVVEKPSGELLWPVEGQDSTGTAVIAVLKSSDRGQTWQPPVLIAADSTLQLASPEIVMLNDQILICMMESRKTGYMVQTTSLNGGKNWQALHISGLAGARPRIVQRHGTLVSVFQDQWPAGLSTAVSWNQGVSWEHERTVDTGRLTEPACPIWREDNIIEIIQPACNEHSYEIQQLQFMIPSPETIQGLAVQRDQKKNRISLRWNSAANAQYYIIYRKRGTLLSSENFTDEARYRTVTGPHFTDTDIDAAAVYSYSVTSVITRGPVIAGTGAESRLCEPLAAPPFLPENHQ